MTRPCFIIESLLIGEVLTAASGYMGHVSLDELLGRLFAVARRRWVMDMQLAGV